MPLTQIVTRSAEDDLRLFTRPIRALIHNVYLQLHAALNLHFLSLSPQTRRGDV